MPTVSKSGSLNILKPSGPVQGLLYLNPTKHVALLHYKVTTQRTALREMSPVGILAQHFVFESFGVQIRAICAIFPLFLYVKTGICSTRQATIVSFQILSNPLITNHVTIRRHVVELLTT